MDWLLNEPITPKHDDSLNGYSAQLRRSVQNKSATRCNNRGEIDQGNLPPAQTTS